MEREASLAVGGAVSFPSSANEYLELMIVVQSPRNLFPQF